MKTHVPPPPAWRGGAPRGAPANSQPSANSQASANAPASRAVAQPMRAFTPHQNNVSANTRRPSTPGDELVAMSGGGFQLRGHERQVLSAPSGTYNFVRVQGLTRNQTATVLSAKAPHAALADGRPVLYAGTAAFESGKLQWWSNYSGTYQPQAELNRQAGLPSDKFVPWQKLQLGGLGMQRTMLSDHRGALAPKTPEPAKTSATTAPTEDKQAAKPAAAATSQALAPGQTAPGQSAQMWRRR